ncbi:hypothetical protein CBOM_07475 [Ceraceosorus bombacis]|uniref:Uncharacterized protein n=1 Tax=Ceraceosorus bombacis TaxID=401625 RepID=A0A0P1BCU1_9BASI|nr:hypothetical protein CBOM_07475 [Ceraceosorus bombacis]
MNRAAGIFGWNANVIHISEHIPPSPVPGLAPSSSFVRRAFLWAMCQKLQEDRLLPRSGQLDRVQKRACKEALDEWARLGVQS